MSRSGADLALLMLGGFRSLVDAATLELATRGYEDVRPVHDFALRAIAAGADSASELGRRMSVTKQAAARTVTVLEERGYVERKVDPADARRMRLQISARGAALLPPQLGPVGNRDESGPMRLEGREGHADHRTNGRARRHRMVEPTGSAP